MPPDTLYCHSPLQTVICSPGRRQAARGNQEVKIPTGASPWARKLSLRTANPRLQSQTDLSGAPTSRYGTLHPSAHPGLRPVIQREGRADTRERIIRLRSGRQQYGDEAACYAARGRAERCGHGMTCPGLRTIAADRAGHGGTPPPTLSAWASGGSSCPAKL